MPINGRFRVSMADVSPAGAFVVGAVEAVRDFEKSTQERFVQQRDRETDLPLWSVSVLDADRYARKGAQTVVVKILDTHQPVPPEAVIVAGHESRTVAFDGLPVTPCLDDKHNRAAYSLRARAMRAPAKGTKASGNSASTDGKAAA